jgi:hypothetical protein
METAAYIRDSCGVDVSDASLTSQTRTRRAEPDNYTPSKRRVERETPIAFTPAPGGGTCRERPLGRRRRTKDFLGRDEGW